MTIFLQVGVCEGYTERVFFCSKRNHLFSRTFPECVEQRSRGRLGFDGNIEAGSACRGGDFTRKNKLQIIFANDESYVGDLLEVEGQAA